MASSAAFELVIELQDKASGGLGGIISQAGAFAAGGFIQKGIESVAGAVTDLVSGSIAEASEWQTQLGQLDAVLQSTGGKAGITKDALLELNKSLSAGGGFSAAADDALLSGQNMLLTFTNIGQDVFPDATKAMLDMATKMNNGVTPTAEQLKATSIQLGKALNDPIKGLGALSKVGVSFTAQQKEQIKAMTGATTAGEALFGVFGEVLPQALYSSANGAKSADEALAILAAGGANVTAEQERMFRSIMAGNGTMEAQKMILGELSTEFGGSATAAMNTFQGQQQLLSEQFNNVKQSIGEKLMPVLGQLMDFLSSPEVQNAIAVLAEVIGDLLVGAFNLLKDTASALGPIIGAVWGFIEKTVVPIAQAIFGELSKWWTEMQPGIQAAWNAIRSAVSDAWKVIEPLLKTGLQFIQTLWNAVWPGIQQTFSGVWTAIQGILQVGWSVISGIWNTVTSVLKGDWEGAWNAIKSMFEGVWKGVETFLGGVWETIKGIWNTGTSYLKTIWEGIWNGISSFFTDIWNGISDFVKGAIETVRTTISTKVDEIKLGWDTFWQGVQDTFTDAWDFITVELPKKLGEFWDTITGWITQTAKDIWTKVQEIGSNIVEGVKQGILNAWTAFTDWIGGMFSGAVDGIKDFLGISSPSRLFAEEIGKPMVQGLRVGFEEEWAANFAPLVSSNFQALFDTSLGESTDPKWQGPGSTIVGGIREGFEEAWGAFDAMVRANLEATWGYAMERAAQIAQMMANANSATGSASTPGTGVGIGDTSGGHGGGGGGGIGVLDRGGIVTGPRLAALAMDGRPEAVIPLDRLERWGSGRGGTTINVTLSAPLLSNSREQAANEIAEMLYERLRGRI